MLLDEKAKKEIGKILFLIHDASALTDEGKEAFKAILEEAYKTDNAIGMLESILKEKKELASKLAEKVRGHKVFLEKGRCHHPSLFIAHMGSGREECTLCNKITKE